MACLRKQEINNFVPPFNGEKVLATIKCNGNKINTQKAIWYNSVGWVLLMGDTTMGRTPFYFEEIIDWKPCL